MESKNSASPRLGRRSVRLQGYDYAAGGVFAVTVCAHKRRLLFGNIVDEHVTLTRIGATVRDEWLRTPEKRPYVRLDEFVVMPNHMHALKVLSDGDLAAEDLVGDGRYVEDSSDQRQFSTARGTVGAVTRGFTGAVTSRVRDGLGNKGFEVWQRGLYEHVVRDIEDLQRIRQYIIENPVRWSEDQDNPDVSANRRGRRR